MFKVDLEAGYSIDSLGKGVIKSVLLDFALGGFENLSNLVSVLRI